LIARHRTRRRLLPTTQRSATIFPTAVRGDRRHRLLRLES
jgi:hypothetical protein